MFNRLLDLLRGLNVKVEKLASDTYSFQANDVDLGFFTTKEFLETARRIRGSVMLIGPLLARFGKAFLPQPGGDKIGRRRLDTAFSRHPKIGGNF